MNTHTQIPGEGNGNPHQYSCLENPMDRGAWQAIVHGVARVGEIGNWRKEDLRLITSEGFKFFYT